LPAGYGDEEVRRGLGQMAATMVGSPILQVAAQIRALQEAGEPVVDMTVGDFAPSEFPIPDRLREALHRAIDAGENNYPPAAGLRELREAIRFHLARTQGLEVPLESILVVGGARPGIFAVYTLLTDPGDVVVYPVPSWNNPNYEHVCRLRARVIRTGPENAFQPTAEDLRRHCRDARLVVLNSPQNPSGGVFRKDEVEAIGRFLLEENRRRSDRGERPLFLLLDQIYRSLVFPGSEHWSPVQLVPECAPWVIHIDGISKCCAATGLRVGWMVGPPALVQKGLALSTHMGSWAPRPAQVATAEFLRDAAAWDDWETQMVTRVQVRLQALYEGLDSLRREGLPVEAIAPQGAIYCSARFAIQGRRTAEGRILESSEDVRSWLLERARFAVLPFSAFGVAADDEDGWFRVSVGASSVAAIREAIPRLHGALASLE